jgi:hypothetical protein
MYRERTSTNRGNSYIGGTQLTGPPRAKYNMFPNTNCDNAGGTFQRTDDENHTDRPGGRGPSCFVEPLPGAAPGQIPKIDFRDYLRSTPPAVRAAKK